MDEKIKNKNIFVSLDTLFDTRLAFIYCLDSTILKTVTDKNKYVNRFKDNFGSISADIFYGLYKKRSKQLLELATPTPVFGLVKEEYGDMVTDIKTNDGTCIIYLNVYPYNLNRDETDNMIEIIQNIIPNAVVKIVSMTKEDISPVWLNDNIGTMFDYFGLDWVEYNTANTRLITTPLLHTTLVIPSIVTGNINSNKIDKKLFEQISTTASTLIDLIVIDTKFFSSIFGK